MATKNDKTAALMRNVTTLVVEALRDGIAEGKTWTPPWWQDGFMSATNVTTGRPYSGGNRMLLGMIAHNNGWANKWATYNQYAGMGAQVRKGEKGTIILVPKSYKRTNESTGKEERGIYFGTAAVFNVAQVDGYVAPDAPPALDPATLREEVLAWETAFRAVADVRTGHDGAYYSPTRDYISLPPFEAFKSADGYAATLAHESVHWTGHESRLDRFGTGYRFGDKAYAMEELRADLGAAMMGHHWGITATIREDHVMYLDHWLKALQRDDSALWEAAGDAEKAVRWLLEIGEGKTPTAPRKKGDTAKAA